MCLFQTPTTTQSEWITAKDTSVVTPSFTTSVLAKSSKCLSQPDREVSLISPPDYAAISAREDYPVLPWQPPLCSMLMGCSCEFVFMPLDYPLLPSLTHCTTFDPKLNFIRIDLEQCAQCTPTDNEMQVCTIALHYTVLHFTSLHCTALHCTVLYCTALHYGAVRCTMRALTGLPFVQYLTFQLLSVALKESLELCC